MADLAGSWEIARPRAPLPGVAAATGYRSRGVTPGLHRGLPSPYLTFVVSIGEPVVASFDQRAVTGGTASGMVSLVGGLHTAPAYVERPTAEAGVQLAVHPLACRALFGMPAAELAGQVVDVADVLGADAHRLAERLHGADTWDDRFDALRALLSRHLTEGRRQPRDDVGEGWLWLARRRGRGTVSGLADHLQLGSRQLHEVFRREVGLSPKRVARLMRFTTAVDHLSAGRSPSLAGCASDCGYADQAHLTREFTEFAGIPPRRWLAEEVRFVQDDTVDSQQGWTHD